MCICLHQIVSLEANCVNKYKDKVFLSVYVHVCSLKTKRSGTHTHTHTHTRKLPAVAKTWVCNSIECYEPSRTSLRHCSSSIMCACVCMCVSECLWLHCTQESTELENISVWLADNKLSLHLGKAEAILFASTFI